MSLSLHRSLRRIALLVFALHQLSCASADNADPEAVNGTGGSSGSPLSLAFTPSTTLTLSTGELSELVVRAEPAGRYRVRFALLPEEGRDPNDAFLDRSEGNTDQDGYAFATLKAPSLPTTFRVRAAIDTLTALRAVSVSDQGFATLEVVPVYGGSRSVTRWVASARAGTTCSALTGFPPADGDLVASSKASENPVVEAVPVGLPLAVTVRSDYFAGGCLDLPPLDRAGTHTTHVIVTDKPLQLESAKLALKVGITDATSVWTEALNAAIEAAARAMLGAAEHDMVALLDAMQAAAGLDDELFATARFAQGWDSALEVRYAPSSSQLLRVQAAQFMVDGAAALFGPDTFVGRAEAGDGAQAMRFTLDSVAGLLPGPAGFQASFTGTWQGDPGDLLLFSLELDWLPSQLVTSLADRRAAELYAEAAQVAEALDAIVGCTDLASELLGGSDEAYPGCGSACLEQLCREALRAIWIRAAAATGDARDALRISASGAITVNAYAEPLTVQGTWLGTLKHADSEGAMGGGNVSGSR